jgi:putative DNA primase/helicase
MLVRVSAMGNINTALDALSFIPPELPYDEWFKVMASAKAAGISFENVNSWCSSATSYKSKDVQSTWNSIKDSSGLTEGTLFYIAKQHGHIGRGQVDYDAVVLQREQTQQHHVQVDRERQCKQSKAAIRAEAILNGCIPIHEHLYLSKKRIEPRINVWVNDKGWLVIPLVDLQGNLHSLQFIDEHGSKQFLKDGAIKGRFYQIWSRVKPSNAIVICEGYATGVTLATKYMTECSVVVAFNANNLQSVAKVFRAAFPGSVIIIAGDNDRRSGTGQAAAKAASEAVLGSYSVPLFLPHEEGSDFNDRWCLDNPERRNDI